MNTGIYCITNIINGKRYIGKSESRDITDRLNMHRHNIQSNRHLQNSIDKYGIDNFRFETIELCSKEECWIRERYWISIYRSNDPEYGYNKTNGGENKSGFVMSEEGIKRSREKRLSMNIRFNLSEEAKKKISISWKNRKVSDETRIRMSESAKNRIITDSTRRKISESMKGSKNPFYGRKHTSESSKKISDSKLGKIAVNNGLLFIMIDSNELQNYIDSGWKEGSLTDRIGNKNPMYNKRGKDCPHYGKRAINKDGITRYVREDKLPEFIANGWSIGKDKSIGENISKSRNYKKEDIL